MAIPTLSQLEQLQQLPIMQPNTSVAIDYANRNEDEEELDELITDPELSVQKRLIEALFLEEKEKENSPDEKKEKWYSLIMQASKIALDKIKPGVKTTDVQEAVRSYFKKEKVDKYWKYSLGHGIGLDVHESPFFHKISKDVLKENMTFAIEPGLHKRGFGGIRIEDDFLLKKKPVKLTKTDYGLIP